MPDIEIIEIEQEIGAVLSLETLETVIETLDVEIIEVAEQGETGPPGPGVSLFEETFSAAMQWVVNHNLGRKPSVTLLSVGGLEMGGTVQHNSVNQLTVYWSLLTAGSIRCT